MTATDCEEAWWCRERCKNGHEWTWEFQEGMPRKIAWPCGCPSATPTVVLWSFPATHLRATGERRGAR